MQSPTAVHEAVRDHYAELARSSSSCCGSNKLYDEQLLKDLPTDVSSFTLGCGDPITLVKPQPGETVLDLGSGGGLDCFLAAKQVGETGHVIGLDMTPEMLSKARASADRLNFTNVEFREGYLEAMPVEEASVDVVISNCVINLSPDKGQVFREMFRVLKPGGRVSVSDIVTNGALPEVVQKSMAAWGACVAGALDAKDYVRGLNEAGFNDVQVQPKSNADKALATLPIGMPFSASITARKPIDGEVTVGQSAGRSDVGTATAGSTRYDQLLSQVDAMDVIEDGYDLHVAGDPTEIRSLVSELSRAADCCSPLRFNVMEAADGVHVRITSSPAAFVSVNDIN